ncbi:alpha/beta hydrolase [Maricaulis sp.]|uniref:alpha/beta hydrolase n=1 Tax=Maricaulis sp. TaxID=1486257 RepID=UPI003A915513
MKRFRLIVLLFTLGACAHPYPGAVSPNPWTRSEGAGPETGIASQTAQPTLLYVTDRAPADGEGYGTDRSSSMAFGSLEIDVTNMSAAAYSGYMSGTNRASRAPRYELADIVETARFPGTPLPFSLENGAMRRDRSAVLADQAARRAFSRGLSDELAARGTGKVVLFVHGFNNSFERGAFSLLELWAASGWEGLPILFSWPTGEPNVLSYFGDTQDGEFSVFHLKETLRLIAANEDVDEVVLIAHSRGASIATTALRELLIESRGAGLSMLNTYRINTLILAAPDIDLGVMEQRLVAEMFGIGFGQIDVYLNRSDDALGVSGWLFGGVRFGSLGPEQLSAESRSVFQGVDSVHFILVEDARGEARHNHFRLHPGVLADIAITMRTGAEPADPERPLTHLDLNFWRIDQGYTPQFTGDRAGE